MKDSQYNELKRLISNIEKIISDIEVPKTTHSLDDIYDLLKEILKEIKR